MNTEFIEALAEIEKEKGISVDKLLEAIQAGLTSAYKRNFGSSQNVSVNINSATGEIKVYAHKNVVEAVEDDRAEVSLAEAQKKDPRYEVGDVLEVEVTPRDFGRIAAQTAKQVVVQRIREAEREIIYGEFSNREGDIVTGIVQRQDQKNVYIDLGKIEAVLGPAEQIPDEAYRHGDRLKTYIVEVKKTTKGPQVLVSRTHPGLLKRLFELEVPEIHDGTVELKSVAREAGARSKIAVYSKDENVDPVGACVGPKGMRVQAIVNELKGEKIDIIKWSQDVSKYVANSLSPAKVVEVDIREDDKVARVVVPDYQLSLAIGKEGQNARLAAKLTGWKIDIKSESQMEEIRAAQGYLEQTEEYQDQEYAEGDYAEEGYDDEYEYSDDWEESGEGYYEDEYDSEYGDEEYYEDQDAEGENRGVSGEEYAGEEYADEEYADEEYADEEYADEEYAGEEYADDEYAGEEYADDEYADDEYYDDEYYEDEGYDEAYSGDGDHPEPPHTGGEETEAEDAPPEGYEAEDEPIAPVPAEDEAEEKGKSKKGKKKATAGKKQPKVKRKKLSVEELGEYLEELEEDS